MEPQKKKINKTLVIINIVALVVILSVGGFVVYDKYFSNKDAEQKGGPGMDFANMSIEDICQNFQERPNDTNRPPDTNRQFDTNNRPSGNFNRPQDTNFDPTKMQAQQQLIQQICADGQVTAAEKQQFESSKNN